LLILSVIINYKKKCLIKIKKKEQWKIQHC
jgi:hypothetical protein